MSEPITNVNDQLIMQYRGRFSPETIRRYTATAEAELRGSIAPEAFPEMIARLVSYRLDQAAPDRIDANSNPSGDRLQLVGR